MFHGFGIFLLNQAMERRGLRFQRLVYLGQSGLTEAMGNYLARRHRLAGESLEPSWNLEVDWELRPPLLDRARELA
ncbi:hypothetical protein [Kribbella sp. CA-294648]|uniref:hypothetical protein n=1 Tax=Kribbella sp. CA-294648 TaxID=3239948 RepID=UPI003D8B78B6